MKILTLRAWDEANKIMHNDFQFIKSGNENNDWIVFTSDKQKLSDDPHPLQNPYFQQQLKIMEGVGIRDCNWKEYFLGDIVKTDTTIQVVDYDDRLHSFGLRQVHGGCISFPSHEWYKFEIIGNIYENAGFLN